MAANRVARLAGYLNLFMRAYDDTTDTAAGNKRRYILARRIARVVNLLPVEMRAGGPRG